MNVVFDELVLEEVVVLIVCYWVLVELLLVLFNVEGVVVMCVGDYVVVCVVFEVLWMVGYDYLVICFNLVWLGVFEGWFVVVWDLVDDVVIDVVLCVVMFKV